MNSLFSYAFLFVCVFATACVKNDTIPVPKFPLPYYPTNIGKEVTYQWAHIGSDLRDSSLLHSDTSLEHGSSNHSIRYDTLVWKIEKDTVAQNKHYVKLINNAHLSNKLIRVENGNYYALKAAPTGESWPLDTNEILFLKENAITGDVWISKNEKYKVIWSKTSYVLNSKYYEHVVYIKREVLDGGDSYYMYARGIGEIYSYLPYPLSERYEDTETKRIKGNQ